MPNIAVVLKEEILRPAHKEVRKQTKALKKVAGQEERMSLCT